MTIPTVRIDAQLSTLLIRPDGSCQDGGTSYRRFSLSEVIGKLELPMSYWQKLYRKLRTSNVIPIGIGLAAFVNHMHGHDCGTGLAIVTTAGVNYLAADFLASSTAHIANFNYHDSGTGGTAPAISDTALVAQAGPTTRATGVQSAPTAGQYRTTASISYTTTLTIVEWGVFSQAAQGGVLWDRRLIGPYSVINGYTVQQIYTATFNAGGS